MMHIVSIVIDQEKYMQLVKSGGCARNATKKVCLLAEEFPLMLQ